MLQCIRLKGVRMAPSHGNGILAQVLYPRLEHIAEVTDGITAWTVPQVIAMLGQGHQFFVQDSAGNRAYVEAIGDSYIKTRPDGKVSDNLLALPGGPLYKQSLASMLAQTGIIGGVR